MLKLKIPLITILIFLVLFFISGCSKQKQSYSYSPPIKGIEFGMTADEISQAKKLSSYNLVKSVELMNASYLELKSQKVLGKNSNVTLYFFDSKQGDLVSRLYSLSIVYNDNTIDNVINLLKKKYGDYKYYDQDTTELYTWSKDTLSSLSTETIERMKTIESSSYNNLTEEQSSLIDLTYKSASDIPLSSIRFIIPKQNSNDYPNATLYIEGKYSLLADLAESIE